MKHPSYERCHELLSYDADTGLIVWRKSVGRARVGTVAGRISVLGYVGIQIDKCYVTGHQLAWFMSTTEWPSIIDHINGDRADNRISNLRNVYYATNARNRAIDQTKNKLVGTYQDANGRHCAAMTADRQKYFLGAFETEGEAHEAYMRARRQVFEAECRARRAALLALQQEAHDRLISQRRAA